MQNAETAETLVSKFNFMSMKAKDIAVSLMTRALDRGDEDRMLERITFHFNRAHDMPEEHKQGLALAEFYDLKCGKSQALRKLSLRTGHVYEDNSLAQPVLN